METPQSAQRRSVNPSTGTESDGISLKTIDRNPQDDPMAANKALLNENQETADEVVASTNSHKSQPPQASTIKGWAWELLAWTTSFASMVTIVGILLATQNKALPEWDHQINLSTLLSVFAQISSTALLVPASGCISQLKWLWFVGRSRTLSDFDTFDEASRGPLSSLWLIWKTRARYTLSYI
jgi:hypothetical protein